MTTKALLSRGVGELRAIPSSLKRIWYAMMDLPAQVAILSYDLALLSARRRGERHSTAKAPEPGKKRANPT